VRERKEVGGTRSRHGCYRSKSIGLLGSERTADLYVDKNRGGQIGAAEVDRALRRVGELSVMGLALGGAVAVAWGIVRWCGTDRLGTERQRAQGKAARNESTQQRLEHPTLLHGSKCIRCQGPGNGSPADSSEGAEGGNLSHFGPSEPC
jgi:hypothetical protein